MAAADARPHVAVSRQLLLRTLVAVCAIFEVPSVDDRRGRRVPRVARKPAAVLAPESHLLHASDSGRSTATRLRTRSTRSTLLPRLRNTFDRCPYKFIVIALSSASNASNSPDIACARSLCAQVLRNAPTSPLRAVQEKYQQRRCKEVRSEHTLR